MAEMPSSRYEVVLVVWLVEASVPCRCSFRFLVVLLPATTDPRKMHVGFRSAALERFAEREAPQALQRVSVAAAAPERCNRTLPILLHALSVSAATICS